MVVISGIEKRTNKAKNQDFNDMVLQGDVEVVISKTTGKPYLTARETSIPCTFSEQFGKLLIGQTLPGCIERLQVEPYEFQIPGSKQKLTLSHTFQYAPDPVTVEEVVG